MNTAYGWPLNGTHGSLVVLLARRRLTWGIHTKTAARPRPSGSAGRAMIRSLGSSLKTPLSSSGSSQRTLKRGHVFAFRQARRELLRIMDLGLDVQEPKRRERTSTSADLPIYYDDSVSSNDSESDDLYSDPDDPRRPDTSTPTTFRSTYLPPPPLSHTSGGVEVALPIPQWIANLTSRLLDARRPEIRADAQGYLHRLSSHLLLAL